MSTYVYETDDPGDELEPCPMGCGGLTDDPAGGPSVRRGVAAVTGTFDENEDGVVWGLLSSSAVGLALYLAGRPT